MFRKILLIFLMGLVSRVVVNYVYDMNVFKDYTGSISLVYYTFIAWFSAFVSEMPRISFNVFKFKIVKSAIRMVVGENLFQRDKIMVGDNVSVDRLDKKDLLKESLVSKYDPNKVTAGRQRTFKSAAMRGLYGEDKNGDSKSLSSEEISRNSKSRNSRNRVKDSRLVDNDDTKKVYKDYSRNIGVGKTINNVVELDGKSFYELDGKNKSVVSINELDGKSLYELEDKTLIPIKDNTNYIPYRPAPVELDGNGKSTTSFIPWNADSYNNIVKKDDSFNKPSVVEKSKSDGSYPQPNVVESPQLGSIHSSERSYTRARREYTRGFVDGINAAGIDERSTTNKNTTALGKIWDRIKK